MNASSSSRSEHLGRHRQWDFGVCHQLTAQVLINAIESAQQSQFECRGCSEAVTPYSLVNTFQLFWKGCHATTNGPSSNVEQDAKPGAQTSQSQNHISVLAEGGICEGVFTHKVRSAKCLYLWKWLAHVRTTTAPSVKCLD